MPPTPYSASGHMDFHYEGSTCEVARVDGENVKFRLLLVGDGVVGVDWHLNSMAVQPGGFVELKVIGSGSLDLRLAVVNLKVTLPLRTIEVSYREVKLGTVPIPFKESLKILDAKPHGVYGSTSLSREFIHRLKGARETLAPISYGWIKPGRIETVVVNGFAFQRDISVQVLRILEAGVRLDPTQSLKENLERIAQCVEGLSLEDLNLIMSNYERIVEAVSM